MQGRRAAITIRNFIRISVEKDETEREHDAPKAGYVLRSDLCRNRRGSLIMAVFAYNVASGKVPKAGFSPCKLSSSL
jgi:hypothetical protein